MIYLFLNFLRVNVLICVIINVMFKLISLKLRVFKIEKIFDFFENAILNYLLNVLHFSLNSFVRTKQLKL